MVLRSGLKQNHYWPRISLPSPEQPDLLTLESTCSFVLSRGHGRVHTSSGVFKLNTQRVVKVDVHCQTAPERLSQGFLPVKLRVSPNLISLCAAFADLNIILKSSHPASGLRLPLLLHIYWLLKHALTGKLPQINCKCQKKVVHQHSSL